MSQAKMKFVTRIGTQGRIHIPRQVRDADESWSKGRKVLVNLETVEEEEE